MLRYRYIPCAKQQSGWPHGGKIINLSSSVVGMKLETYGIYTASKAAIESLTAILAEELRGKNITVNAIAPGPNATELFLKGKSDELIERLRKVASLERLGTVEDIVAAMILRLMSRVIGSMHKCCW